MTIMLSTIQDIPYGIIRHLAARRPSGFDAWIRDVGCYEAGQDYAVHGLQQRDVRCAFQYTIAGHGLLRYHGDDLRVAPGQAMVLTTPDDYLYRASEEGWTFFYVCFEGAIMQEIFTKLIEQTGPILTPAPDSEAVKLAASVVRDVLNADIPDYWQTSEHAYSIGMRLLREAALAGSNSTRNEDMERALAYIHRHFLEPLTIDDLAEEARLSRFHFSRLFHAYTGVSPGEFILQERLQHATSLLKMTNLPVAEVALRSGFNDASYFGKQFRKHHSCSPGRYRTENRLG